MSTEKSRSLLIVEDDLALQKQLRWSFDQFETLTAADRESALAQIHRHSPPVVTMDLGLPPDADRMTEQTPFAPSPSVHTIFLPSLSNRSCWR